MNSSSLKISNNFTASHKIKINELLLNGLLVETLKRTQFCFSKFFIFYYIILVSFSHSHSQCFLFYSCAVVVVVDRWLESGQAVSASAAGLLV